MRDFYAATLLFVGIACVSWNQHPAMGLTAGDGPSAELAVHYHDGGMYRGLLVEEKRNGRGVMDYPDGTRYRGEWKNDQRHGAGELLLPDGSRYTGFLPAILRKVRGVHKLVGEKMRVVYASGRLVSKRAYRLTRSENSADTGLFIFLTENTPAGIRETACTATNSTVVVRYAGRTEAFTQGSGKTGRCTGGE
jgi:hypothetical protein